MATRPKFGGILTAARDKAGARPKQGRKLLHLIPDALRVDWQPIQPAPQRPL
ncbi:hypothetical protein GCM10009069_06070 [Algimonas arctica]|uniref:Uncharacterized protein n=1 Tax=Algimonas arctica TaxID=1479486 RepID=A0A8J3CQ70_9PROT|nr:hypothetical protein GCM10009069_06070 [Algimonas arctica]